MKKIIIVNNNLNIGGIQISLINLIKEITSIYDITLLLFYADEKKLESLPKNIKVITVKSPFKYLGLSLEGTKSSLGIIVVMLFLGKITKVFGKIDFVRIIEFLHLNVQIFLRVSKIICQNINVIVDWFCHNFQGGIVGANLLLE